MLNQEVKILKVFERERERERVGVRAKVASNCKIHVGKKT